MMSNLLKYLIIFHILLNVVSAQVTVSIPDTSHEPGEYITIPISVSNLSGQGVRAYHFMLKYDQSILKFKSVETKNTLSDIWSWDVDSDLEDDGLEIKADGWIRLSGSGILLNLKFRIRGDEGSTDLKFDHFIFNNGKPEAKTINGRFTIYS
ncbi:MAG: cohesin domain-containing protein, partial [Melioribacteraceae bacterium]|nr:cohesin domain-containing protein [Melioribacteraceae bacterium]